MLSQQDQAVVAAASMTTGQAALHTRLSSSHPFSLLIDRCKVFPVTVD
ncbi:hypothetical protein PROVRUST_07430 [Providencia rustigianii DSM 4541]|uniref:Uncharacterized protein n=1 Tax=Providencia rustigianii DSM 4541 TaxID=500637 RepID=D1P5C5_9GAMM|nr:hypothetical protein PROVRUST_07430 [Providencia rustigianii DSM 4541]